LRHGCEHAFILYAPRLELLLDHSLALRGEIRGWRDLLAAARRRYRRKKQILRDDSHSQKDNAACTPAKGALSFFRDSLSYRRHGVHVTQAIGQRFHHMRRKMRRLLNEKDKPTPIDLRQLGGGLRHSVGRARTIINQRHLTEEHTRAGGLEHKVTKEDIDFPFQ